MGYNTEFDGCLKFTTELTASQLAHLKSFFGEESRVYPDWGCNKENYIDLCFASDFSGIQWNGGEKTYGMLDSINYIIGAMCEKWPGFGLIGKLTAQGEEFNDSYAITINQEGRAVKIDTPPVGEKITCPHCEESFYYEAQGE